MTGRFHGMRRSGWLLPGMLVFLWELAPAIFIVPVVCELLLGGHLCAFELALIWAEPSGVLALAPLPTF